MPSIQTNRLTNANVLLNGNSLLGTCQEFKVPMPKPKMSDHQAIGMVGALELPSGIEKLEASFKWNAIYGDVMGVFANPYQAINLTVRGNLETWQGSTRTTQTAVKVFLTGTPKDLGDMDFKKSDNVELTSMLNVTAVKFVIGDRVIVDYDALNNIHIVDGVDTLAEYRANLGI